MGEHIIYALRISLKIEPYLGGSKSANMPSLKNQGTSIGNLLNSSSVSSSSGAEHRFGNFSSPSSSQDHVHTPVPCIFEASLQSEIWFSFFMQKILPSGI